MNSLNILELNSNCYFSIVIINWKLNMYTEVNGVYGQLPIVSDIEQVNRLTEIQQEFNSTIINSELYIEITELVEEIEDILNEDKSLEDLYEHKYLTTLYPILVDEKIVTLGKYLELTPKEVQERLEDANGTYIIDKQEYYVYTDEEAEEVAKEYAQSLLDIALHDVPTYLYYYFDSDLFIKDTLDGDRGYLITGNEEIQFGNYNIYKL